MAIDARQAGGAGGIGEGGPALGPIDAASGAPTHARTVSVLATFNTQPKESHPSSVSADSADNGTASADKSAESADKTALVLTGPIEDGDEIDGRVRIKGHPNLQSFRRGQDPRRAPARKSGPIGRPPDAFRAACRELVTRDETLGAVERILGDPKHPAFVGALKWATEYGFGKPTQHIEHSGPEGGPVEHVWRFGDRVIGF